MNDQEITGVWNEYHPKVFGYFYRRVSCRQDVEDLTSISLTAFLNKLIADGDAIENEPAYLWRICHNQLANYIRSKTKNPVSVPYEEDWVPDDKAIETNHVQEFNMRIDSLKNCISKNCSPNEVEVVELSFFEEMNSIEIADKIGIRPPAVRKRLSRALSKIREVCNDLWSQHT